MTITNFQERDINGVTILTVERGLNGAIESLLKDRIDDLVQKGRLQIVVDLKQVPYVDSSDIGRIIRAHRSVRQAGGRVRLCNLTERVLEVLKLTRLDTILDLYQNEEEAMAGILHDQTGAREAVAEEPA